MAASKTFGASIEPTHAGPYQNDALIPPGRLDSPALTPTVSNEDMTGYHDSPVNAPIHSPFYTHPPASFERVHSRQNSKNHIVTYEKDLEAAHNNSTLTPLSAAPTAADDNPFTSKVSVEHSKECKMWPSKQTLMQEKAAERRKKLSSRGCAPVRHWWAKFDRKHKLIMKLILAFLVVGAIVGICVGISVRVHGTYVSRHGAKEIGE
ncbi:hypothetical protein LTR56_022934 [Elasticomyces elasticus]|nr:hypothetical protein LTR56_022934 [Elasticomyces elasticus]KAK3627051.1 hypothetical protein LTR22_022910 [Elasticomyces elasticus]KAK4907473.1 hypothetical protein LTR49_023497 [Elasticomyces elasticus]KAK5719896.1 hypothetical protein LTR15_007169 [Elasticomyces elasticus]KAK5747881.1 hypothetical protein LTS12_022079 [Elasticomyces elasticus]